MKWMIASDIHGSALFCRQLLAAFEAERADRLLLLGDLLYHGPRNDLPEGYDPREVPPLLNAYRSRILCVRGNCDAEVDRMLFEFPVHADYTVLPVEERLIFATHGHIWSPDAPPPLQPDDVLLCGHTHIPLCEQRGGLLCLNPGSVSIPKGGSARGYMLLEGRQLSWHTLDGEVWQRHTL